MKKEFIEQEIERQKKELAKVLISNMKEPERSKNIIRITKTIKSLREFLKN